nr:MAG TPA: hypothetical protein [Bacteriophage sp.]
MTHFVKSQTGVSRIWQVDTLSNLMSIREVMA